MLLRKLSLYGVRGLPLQFFRSYFCNGFQYTKINDIKSDTLPNTRGVPQGSALGPLFFSIFINDIITTITSSRILLYADYIVIINSGHNLTSFQSSINNDLKELFKYTISNKLKRNFSKTKTMTFSRKTNVNISIFINENLIEKVSEFTYLGLIIDEKLTFKNHILNIVKKVNQANRCVYSLKKYLPLYILKRVYFSMVHSHLVQHLISWGGANTTNLYPLRVAINKVIRNLFPSNLSTNDRYKILGIPNLSQLYNLKLAETMYKIIILRNSPLLTDIINEIQWAHNYNTRRMTEFRLPMIYTQTNKIFFLSNAIKLWSRLPNHLKLSSTISCFKRNCKSHLLESL